MRNDELREAVEAAVTARNATRRGAEVTFTCPNGAAHKNGDAHPSARYNAEKAVWTCDVCGEKGGLRHLAEALGLDPGDAPQGGREVDGLPGVRAQWEGLPYQRHAVYRSAAGDVLGCVVRYRDPASVVDGRKPPKADVPFFVFDKGAGRWGAKSAPTPRPLYGLDRLAKAPADDVVWLTEGEGKADTLGTLGALAVTWPGGCKAVKSADFGPLAGREVVVWPDNDAVGFKAARDVVEALGRLDPPARVRVVEVEALDLPPAGDVEQWSDAGGTGEALAGLRTLPGAEWRAAHPAGEVTAAGEAGDGRETRLVVVTWGELDEREIAERELILSPWLHAQDLSMLYGKRGTGKTWTALSVACAVASGGAALGWRAPKARPVLYVDGEMPARTLQDRLRAVAKACGVGREHLGNLRILTGDVQPDAVRMPNIATSDGQKAVDALLDGVELLILDNLSCLARGLDENDASDWEEVQAWTLALRRRGLAVLLVHHAGKAGDQRGTSRREDVLDTSLQVRQPEGYHPEDGCHVEVHFKKSRNLYGPDAAPVDARLVQGPEGGLIWTVRGLEESREARALALADDGLNLREIAEEIGVNKSTVSRWLKVAPGVKPGAPLRVARPRNATMQRRTESVQQPAQQPCNDGQNSLNLQENPGGDGCNDAATTTEKHRCMGGAAEGGSVARTPAPATSDTGDGFCYWAGDGPREAWELYATTCGVHDAPEPDAWPEHLATLGKAGVPWPRIVEAIDAFSREGEPTLGWWREVLTMTIG
jgi:KaiC/GvpD/RAD55 family RecA-like ATPase